MNERMILIVPSFSTTMFPIDPRRISDEVSINQSIYGAAVFITRTALQQCKPFSFGPFFSIFEITICTAFLHSN